MKMLRKTRGSESCFLFNYSLHVLLNELFPIDVFGQEARTGYVLHHLLNDHHPPSEQVSFEVHQKVLR